MGNIINELYQITTMLRNGEHVDFEKVDEALTHYCENPIFDEEGVTYPFTDPVTAETLNGEYRAKTGVDHSNYVAHQMGIINGLLQDKDMLLQAGAYKPEYFKQIEAIKSRIEREGLLTADKFGNPVPVNIDKKMAGATQHCISCIGKEKGTAIVEDGQIIYSQGDER